MRANADTGAKRTSRPSETLIDRFVTLFARHGSPKGRLGRTLERREADETIRWVAESDGELPPHAAAVARAFEHSA